MSAAELEAYVERVVAEAPPLSELARERIASLMRPAGGAT